MEKTYLGNSGIPISRVALGTMTMGGQTDSTESTTMLDIAFESGIRFFDTANMYNAGNAEKILGDWVHERGVRDQVVIATKVYYEVGDDGGSRGLSRPNLYRQLDASLQRLGMDYVDVYYMHAPDHQTTLEDALHTMDTLARDGKIRALGLSNFASWQIAEAVALCDRHGWLKPTVVQPMYNLVARDIEREILPCCRRYGLAVCAYNPLAGGLLTGKHRHDEDPEPGGRFATNRYYVERFWHKEHFEAVAALSAVATRTRHSLIGLALRWLLDQPAVTNVLLGASNITQLQTNLKALDELRGEALAADVRQECDAIYATLRGHPPRVVR